MSANIFSPVPCCNDGSNQGLDTTHVTHRDFVLLVVACQITVGEKQTKYIFSESDQIDSFNRKSKNLLK